MSDSHGRRLRQSRGFGRIEQLERREFLDAASILIGSSVVATDLERFGANWADGQLNSWTTDPGMEGQTLRLSGTATGGDTDTIVADQGAKTWRYNTIKDGFFNGATVRVYRTRGDQAELVRTDVVEQYFASDPDAGGNGFRIELASEGPNVERGDFYLLDHFVFNAPLDSVADRLVDVRDYDTWRMQGLGERVRDQTTSAPENGGQSSLRLTSIGGEEPFAITQYQYGGLSTIYRQFEPGRTYRMEVWLKQERLEHGEVRFRMDSEYKEIDHLFTGVTDEWQKFSFDFVGPDYPDSSLPVVQNILEFVGPGIVWVDNLIIYDPAYEPFAVRAESLQAMTEFDPGPIRIWSGQTNERWGTTLEDWTNPEILAQRTWNANVGTNVTADFKLPTALAATRSTGGTPWLLVGSYMDESEWLGLIEYLAGPEGTEYGDKRISQGQVEPWTDEFDTIRLELGNETWNKIFTWTYRDGEQYGKLAEYFYNVAKSSPHYEAVADKIEFVLGGWVARPELDGWGQQAAQASPTSEYVGLSGYIGGWESGVHLGGDEVNDEGFRSTLVYSPHNVERTTDAHAVSRDILAERGVDYQLAVYEGGPGYDLPRPGSVFNSVQETYGKSLAAGVATLDAFLYRAYHGAGPQAYFQFEPGWNWSSHTSVVDGFHAHPAWQALQLRNEHVTGDMVLSRPLDVPTVDLPANGPVLARDNVPLITTYAFQDGDDYSIFVLSRDLDEAHDVTLLLPFGSAETSVLHTLTGDPRANNLDGRNVKPAVVELEPPSSNAYTIEMPPGSIYLLKFNGTSNEAATQPTVVISRMPGQESPGPIPLLRFQAVFSEPVKGFTAEDVRVSGSANAQSVTLREIPGSKKMAYEIIVRDMDEGLVSLVIRTGGAWSAETGELSLRSESFDNDVVFERPAPKDELLAYDDFDATRDNAPLAPFLQAASSGDGWIETWKLQTFDVETYEAGFELERAQPLLYPNLASSIDYATGGRDYQSASRELNMRSFPNVADVGW